MKRPLKAHKESKAQKKALLGSGQSIVPAGQKLEDMQIQQPKKRRLVPSTKYSHREIGGRLTHHALSVALPVAIYVLVAVFHLPWVALSLVLLSKWQIFIVKPRFWWANLKFSAVDLIFKLSILSLMLLAQFKIDGLVTRSTVALSAFQILLTGLYLFWNIYLRKQTTALGMRLQALSAQFLALTAIMWSSGFSGPTLPLSIALILCWVTTYAAAQHTLFAYEESAIPQIASFWALFATSLSLLQLIWAQNFIFSRGIFYLPVMPFIISAFAVLAANTHAFIEDKQSEQDVPRAQLEKEKEKLGKQGVGALFVTIFIALLIILR